MKNSLVITFITDDKPGVIETLADIIKSHKASWLESRLSHLGGKFAGIISVSVNEEDTAALDQQLNSLRPSYTINAEICKPANASQQRTRTLSLIGLDRPGIVHEISAALAYRHLNVVDMKTDISSAPMSGEPLFEAQVKYEINEQLSTDDLQEALDTIASQLDIDISLEDLN